MERQNEKAAFGQSSENGQNRLLYVEKNEGEITLATDERLLEAIKTLSEHLKATQEENRRLLSLIERLTNSNK